MVPHSFFPWGGRLPKCLGHFWGSKSLAVGASEDWMMSEELEPSVPGCKEDVLNRLGHQKWGFERDDHLRFGWCFRFNYTYTYIICFSAI